MSMIKSHVYTATLEKGDPISFLAKDEEDAAWKAKELAELHQSELMNVTYGVEQ
tara:strand:- start:369 stop:530 length:162 start_codon:yes stop_codon:yes gene_type:complete